MKITKTQIESLYTNLAVLNRNINVMSEYAKQLKIELDSIVSNHSSKKKCKTNSNQMNFQFNNVCTTLDAPSSTGFENSMNPARQMAGRRNGLAGFGIKHAHATDRREYGSVDFKNMSVNEKRQYWRWSKYRSLCRKAGLNVPSWNEWTNGLA